MGAIIITIAGAAAALAGIGWLARRYARMRRERDQALVAIDALERANETMGNALFGKDAIERAVLRANSKGRN